MESEVEDSVGVSPFVIVPRNDLVEVVIETNSCLGVEDRRSSIMHEILRDDFFLGETKNSLKFIFRSFLHGFNDACIGGSLVELDGQVNDGHINGGHTEGHTSELALELRKDESDSLGSTSRRGNDVSRSSTASSPVLATLGGSIDDQLSSSGSVNGGHETFSNAEFVIENLSNGGKAVSGAGSVGDDVLRSLIFLVVDTVDESRSGVFSRSREQDLLGTSLQVSLSLFLGEESTSGFADEVSTIVTPLKVSRVLFSEEVDLLSVD